MSRATVLFPLFALLVCALAYVQPAWFSAGKPAIVPLLALIMFSMGMTLSGADFQRVARRPRLIALGMAMQYTIMPLAAWVVAHALALPPELSVGLILVGASAGGTASNVVTFLARGDVALSITLTLCSTLLAVFATPLLTLLYVGTRVPVPVYDMLLSVAQMVILPVLAGTALNTLFGTALRPLQALFPLLSMGAIVVIIGIIVALNQGRIAQMGVGIALAVVLHNSIGLGSGYALARLFGLDPRTCRTLAIEVGMQNSGLSVALAIKHFSAAAALPGAVFSIWHNLSGALLAGYWSSHDKR